MHKHTPEEERRIREAALDETLEETFPASDPLSTDPNPDDHGAARGRGAELADETEEPTKPDAG